MTTPYHKWDDDNPPDHSITNTTAAIQLEILNNWGNPDYTCLYRIRVHGILVHRE
jgi:Sad1 / UNC-like C-terminal